MRKIFDISSSLKEAYKLLESDEDFSVSKNKNKKTNKEIITEEKWVNIEDYLPEQSYIESFDLNENAEEIDECDSQSEYSQSYKNKVNERIDTYKKLCNLDEDVDITEEHINKHDHELKTLCLKKGGTPEEVKQQLLKGYYK